MTSLLKTSPSLSLASLAAAFGLSLFPSLSSAQHRDYRDRGLLESLFGVVFENPAPRGGGGCQVNGSGDFRLLGQYVGALDNNAEVMVSRYGNELRYARGCSCSAALFEEMKRHLILTHRLNEAYRGSCSVTFNRAASETEASALRLASLRRNAQVSDSISVIINDSVAKAGWIRANSRSFVAAPVATPPVPVYSPAYFDLGNQVNLLASWSAQMLSDYTREASCGCKNSQFLLGEIREYHQATLRLSNAWRGSCPVTFSRTAREVRENLDRVERARGKARVSSNVSALIAQSRSLASGIANNSSQFRPYNHNAPVNGGGFGPGRGNVWGRTASR